MRKVLDSDPEYSHFQASTSIAKPAGLVDWVIGEGSLDPVETFNRLRWGGQFVAVTRSAKEAEQIRKQFAEREFAVDEKPRFIRLGWGLPLVSPRARYVIGRKTLLIPPRDFSDRFTYQVQLEHRPNTLSTGTPGTDQWVVRKEVPTFERVLARLKFKAPEVPAGVLEKRARKFVEQIFPLFLTRETAMLRIIERDVPPEYAKRFPKIVHLEKDSKGYVQRLWTTWLRNGGTRLSQLEFCKQSADLLHILHDRIGIMHLDLRMDNMVVTEHGVGFVDFGSAVRVNENIHGNAVLSTLFGELMRTSQIQRMLDRMSTTGGVTSHLIRDAYQKVDKAVDLFYLAVQMGQPTANPDLRELIRYEPASMEAAAINGLTHEILRPANPRQPVYRTAHDVLQALIKLEADLKAGRVPASALRPSPVSNGPKITINTPAAIPKAAPVAPARPAAGAAKPAAPAAKPATPANKPATPAAPQAASGDGSKPKVVIWK